jgi:hypothetical protein
MKRLRETQQQEQSSSAHPKEHQKTEAYFAKKRSDALSKRSGQLQQELQTLITFHALNDKEVQDPSYLATFYPIVHQTQQELVLINQQIATLNNQSMMDDAIAKRHQKDKVPMGLNQFPPEILFLILTNIQDVTTFQMCTLINKEWNKNLLQNNNTRIMTTILINQYQTSYTYWEGKLQEKRQEPPQERWKKFHYVGRTTKNNQIMEKIQHKRTLVAIQQEIANQINALIQQEWQQQEAQWKTDNPFPRACITKFPTPQHEKNLKLLLKPWRKDGKKSSSSSSSSSDMNRDNSIDNEQDPHHRNQVYADHQEDESNDNSSDTEPPNYHRKLIGTPKVHQQQQQDIFQILLENIGQSKIKLNPIEFNVNATNEEQEHPDWENTDSTRLPNDQPENSIVIKPLDWKEFECKPKPCTKWTLSWRKSKNPPKTTQILIEYLQQQQQDIQNQGFIMQIYKNILKYLKCIHATHFKKICTCCEKPSCFNINPNILDDKNPWHQNTGFYHCKQCKTCRSSTNPRDLYHFEYPTKMCFTNTRVWRPNQLERVQRMHILCTLCGQESCQWTESKCAVCQKIICKKCANEPKRAEAFAQGNMTCSNKCKKEIQ